ncbi:MAG: PaaI family thioesterase [Deltaproteobacteria bacterium]|nr:PaaI family thioesterase [Deltaproteobacteria bacterium]
MISIPSENLSANNIPPASHCNCIVCGSKNPASLGISFELQPDSSILAQFRGNALLQGYKGILHGGIIASILDAAMTHCLFKNGIEAVTADLNVRFKHSIPYDALIDVTAKIISDQKIIYRLDSNIHMDGKLMAKANARFMLPQPNRI